MTERSNRNLLPDLVFLSVLFAFFVVSCKKDNPSSDTIRQTPYTICIPKYFPTQLNIPADNPMTVEGVELGRFLFYDGRLSGRTDPDSMMSCSSCHLQSRSFECGIDHPKYTGGHTYGITGILTPHYMLPMINLAWTNHGFLWSGLVNPGNPDPRKRHLEDLVWMGIIAPHEMNGDTSRSKELISQTPGYPELFGKAFGNKTITVKNIGRAIAQFIRTLISADSKFDRFLKGEMQLNPDELRGYVLFMTEQGGDCFHCHGGEGNPLFTTNLFYNNARDSLFSDTHDHFSVTSDPSDIGAYKAPTLRNLVFTAPYMHDGRFQTLDEVLAFYNSGLVWSPSVSPFMHHLNQGGVHLTPLDLNCLKAFLLTLTDSSFIANPAFSKPDKMPDE